MTARRAGRGEGADLASGRGHRPLRPPGRAWWPFGPNRRARPVFTVLVCPLDGVNGADGGLAANAVLQALRQREGLKVRVVRGSPTAAIRPGGGLPALLAHTQSVGRTWLEGKGADALVWGQRANDRIRLSIITPLARRGPRDTTGLHPWSTLQLPLPIPPLGADLLHAFILAAITPDDPARRLEHDRAFRRALARTEHILLRDSAPPGDIRDGYRVALGLLQRAHALHGHRSGRARSVRLYRAIRLLDTGLDALSPIWPRDLVALARLDWAETLLTLTAGAPAGARSPSAAALSDRLVATCQAAIQRLPATLSAETHAAVSMILARALRHHGRAPGEPEEAEPDEGAATVTMFDVVHAARHRDPGQARPDRDDDDTIAPLSAHVLPLPRQSA